MFSWERGRPVRIERVARILPAPEILRVRQRTERPRSPSNRLALRQTLSL